MRTFWHSKESVEFEKNRVGKAYEKYRPDNARLDALKLLRQETGHGLMDTLTLLRLYLNDKGMTIDDNKNIVNQ